MDRGLRDLTLCHCAERGLLEASPSTERTHAQQSATAERTVTMNDILDFVKRRSLLALAILVGAVVLVVLLALFGAKLWHALLGVLGLGGTTLQIYAKKDAQRQQDQRVVEDWKDKQLQKQEAERLRKEQQAKEAQQRKEQEIQRASQEETPEQLRERLLKEARGGSGDA